MGCNKSKPSNKGAAKSSPEIVIQFVDDKQLEKEKKEEKEKKSKQKTEGNKDQESKSEGSDISDRRRTIKVSDSASCIDVTRFTGKPPNPIVETISELNHTASGSLTSDYVTVCSEDEFYKNIKDKAAPKPSAGITKPINNRKNVQKTVTVKKTSFSALLRLICAATNDNAISNQQLLSLDYHRTCLISTIQSSLLGWSFADNCLHRLNLSGNRAGPVAVKALLLSLLKSDNVMDLDLSDNMADSDSSEVMMKILEASNCLQQINLSGNRMGKESLSKRLAEGLQHNKVLVHLNISNCGVSNLSNLFEGIKTSYSISSSLEHLNISDNEIADGHQLGSDIAALLEHPCCCLSFLNIENTGLKPLGWDAVIASLKKNQSLREFVAGGSSNQIQNVLKIADIIFSNQLISRLNLGGLQVQEKPSQENVDIIVDETVSNLNLTYLNLANCGLTDKFLTALSNAYPEKLTNLTSLNLSNNPDLTAVGVARFESLLTCNGKSSLKSLILSGLTLNDLTVALPKSFLDLKQLTLNKLRIPLNELSKLSDVTPSLTELSMDGIKFGKSEMLSSLLVSSKHHFTSFSLRGCSLTDTDLAPLVTAYRSERSPFDVLKHLDISVNRLVNTLKDLASVFCKVQPCLESLNVSQNDINDDGACALAEYLLSSSKRCLKTLSISQNNLTKKGLLALMSIVQRKAQSSGVISLDVSNQQSGLFEDDLEDVLGALTAAIGLDPELALQDAQQSIPMLSDSFNVNLTKLGGTAGPHARQLDSVAVKTDFIKLCNTSPGLHDYLLISDFLLRNSAATANENLVFTSNEWSSVVGLDSPSWLLVENERKKSVYVNHLPGSATTQRLQSILEMEADCLVSEIVFIKDPIFFKQSGAAWILFEDENSVKLAVDLYVQGHAQMFGTPFTISAISVTILDAQEDVKALAQKEKEQREAQRQQKEKRDQAMMEESQQLANERAAYREAHPAYQNGRIW